LTDTNRLIDKSRWVRRQVLEMVAAAGKGHIGGALSCTDILVALFYGGILRFNPADPRWEGRDRFILSKGHSGVALYAILADLGFFPVDSLGSFCRNGTFLGGHPDRNIPGVEVDSGSLGHGLAIGCGLAAAAGMDGRDYLTVVLMGDGECQEGSVWEAAMFAAQHRLGNLVAIVDNNGQGVTDYTDDSVSLEPFAGKWRGFNWEAREIDGHSFEALLGALRDVRSRGAQRPLVIIARTIKGKGVSFMERELEWHHGVPTGDKLEKARRELAP
jgi:transketolase